MRGLDQETWLRNFKYAADRLREQGFEVFSPAEKGCEVEAIVDPTLQNNLAFRRKVFEMDLCWICAHADVVALLPNWRNSKGAIAEKAAAEAVGLTVMELGMEYAA